MHVELNQWLAIAAIVLVAVIGHRLTAPSAKERAELLAALAQDAAALAVSMNPNASWAALLANVITQVSTASGAPTRNHAAIQRAAAAALTRLGVRPGI